MDQFQCKSGHCIPLRWRCDADADCMDGSDEEACSTGAQSGQVKPGVREDTSLEQKSQLCGQMSWLYRGGNLVAHSQHSAVPCPHCGTIQPSVLALRTCPLDEFQCNNTLCKPLAWKCDGEDDCGDNSDENPEECAQFVCPPNRPFRCKNDRVCLWIGRQCDGTDNCGDGTDEEDCEPPTAQTTHCKDKKEFLCRNRRCLSSSLRCNMFDDCGDGSDEEDCSIGEARKQLARPQGGGSGGRSDLRPGMAWAGGIHSLSPTDPKLTSCTANASICGDEARCVRTEKAAYCACRSGFHTVPGQPGCQDINECLRFGTCSQLCNNTKGGHLCSCARNFMKTHNTCKAEGAAAAGGQKGFRGVGGAGGQVAGIANGADLEWNVFLRTPCPDRKLQTPRCTCLGKGLAQAEEAGPGATSLKESGVPQCSELHTPPHPSPPGREHTQTCIAHSQSWGLTCTFPTCFDTHLCLVRTFTHTPAHTYHTRTLPPCTPARSMSSTHTPRGYTPLSMCQAVCSREHGDAIQRLFSG
ncbi:hypothetical protein P7K49_019638 [Saguinus oedipus]|uniref:Uncharacterized protein n=1 Tax=Saguinus oedipus TaxID=9490 RepID=A0ABQ9UY98_SAGOE|nr:hypothetical protein P7K49_019638 [Saguinus oedipus]